MIKAVLFDFDGVLTTDKTGSESILKYLAQQTGICLEKLKTAYYRYNNPLLRGELTHADIWADFCRELGADMSYELLPQAFRHTPLDPEMLGLARSLKKSCWIGMVTDNKCDRIDEILRFNCLDSLFDVVSVSAQYGSGKSERAIFEGTLAALNVAPEECIFIDNSEKNLIVPREMGIRAIFFDDEIRDIDALKVVRHGLMID